MNRPTHDQYFLAMLKLTASRGTCSRRQVGAILVDHDHHVISTGYNGVPRSAPHCVDSPCPGRLDAPGDTRDCYAVHAEVNAVLQAGDRLHQANTLYVSCTPCFECAKMLANVGLQRVVCVETYADVRGWSVLKNAGTVIYEVDAQTGGLVKRG